MSFDVNKIRQDFPILNRKIDGKPLIYLDNAATSQKPQAVIDAIVAYYQTHNANIHRGIHTLSEEATQLYENTRKKTADFLGARKPEETIFTSGATAALNLVAFGWAVNYLEEGDIILTALSEHHSNLIPWQNVAERTGAKLAFFALTENGELTEEELKTKITEHVKLIVIAHISNVLGTIFPVKRICELAHAVGAKVVVDGAQAAPHMRVNVQSLGCDFYAFSAHKMLGPTGVGVLWGKMELLEPMEPTVFGGGMIDTVSPNCATWAEIPYRFEAGTPNIAGVVGLGAAIDYVQTIGMQNIEHHEQELTAHTLRQLTTIEGLRILGPKKAQARAGLVAFTVRGIHPHDISAVLNSAGIAVRSGHHCTMPLHKELEIPASTRASWYLYNTKEELDKLVEAINEAKKILR